jgi:hypothetical protein
MPPDEIVFTRGTTEAINLVAGAWGGANLGPDTPRFIRMSPLAFLRVRWLFPARGHLMERTALADLLGSDDSLAAPHVLYGCHDKLLEHKQALFSHLVDRWRDLFNASFEVLLYDLTSTYFESDPAAG